MKVKLWMLVLVAVAIVYIAFYSPMQACAVGLVYCPGVGCVSGPDKCFPGARGGPSAIFSREGFVNKQCPDGTRTDGPCLMEF